MKFAFIHAEKASLPVAALCRHVGVSRSGYYAWAKRPESARVRSDRALAVEVAAVHHESKRRYGSPRVQRELRARGRHVSAKRVARLMRQQGLAARRKKRHVRTTDSRHAHPVAPNVLDRDFLSPAPNTMWAGDITYVWTAEGWLYLAVVLDLFSRRVVGWAVSERIDRQLVLDALRAALRGRPAPQLYHSDRGSQYASEDYRQAELDPVSWTPDERQIRCPTCPKRRGRAGSGVASPMSSRRVLSGSSSKRARASLKSLETWT